MIQWNLLSFHCIIHDVATQVNLVAIQLYNLRILYAFLSQVHTPGFLTYCFCVDVCMCVYVFLCLCLCVCMSTPMQGY